MAAIQRIISETAGASIAGNLQNENSGVNITQDTSVSNFIGSSVDILKMSMKTNGGTEIDLTGYYANIVVQEDMFSPAITGFITIADTEGGLEKFAIHGGETLAVKIAKPNNGEIIIWREDLVVHKVTKNEVVSGVGPLQFDLVFSSRSFVQSLKTNVFKSYSKMGIAEAVLNVYKDMSKNDLLIEDPKITLKKPYIATGIPAHKVIDALAQRACSKDKYFVFFERFVPLFGNYSDGQPFTTSHYFGSVEKLISDAETNGVRTIHFMPKLDANIEGKIIRAARYMRHDNFNHLPGMMLGFYNTIVSTINPVSRKFATKKLSYANEDAETTDFYSNKLLSSMNVFNIYNDTKNETPGRKLIMSSINDSVAREDWMNNHIYGQLSKTMFKIEVDIQGGTNNISVGNVVKFVAPSSVAIQANPTNAFPEIDPIYSGKYLVTAVTHVLKDSKYLKTLTLSRGSSPFNFDTHALTVPGTEFDDLKQEYMSLVLGNKRTP